ncbi:MAG: hypothetical protein CL814_14730 [Confluentimicrobium sp.]|jgi:hypothetical protein|uniref:hypothetical protein n=1 Tax=Actibacterium sp. TaxID=1872125 RepID=UPI000C48B28A|nr:hypothetical protein [Actibacterium sp.]MBC58167.1 hypothetical protein [Actibacterium sp.]MDY6858301.1 hypothetical protein [Pseudomonadota bacterium]|tara:strand:+ start:2547 stop:2885 length:339 start_codon:yes stop_codon:yes gene_type:complete
MPEAPVDQLTRAALEALLKGPDGWRHVVRDLAREAPDASPLALIFALVAAASTIEEFFAPGSPSRPAADHALRLAAILGTDLYAMEALGLPHATAAELTAYWQAHDPYFLTL